ncbi:MAG: discoidin domain-containing protein, partial [Vicinamibacteria bacterium]|nr:discoidin domain-containing protein [Vicinamibacteria bacterium]
MKRSVLLVLSAALPLEAQQYTRGVGVYPGDPRQDHAPLMKLETETYRNLALRRPAYHSSSYDYNLTAQTVTDGIRHARTPRWIATSTSKNGALGKDARELPVDRNPVTFVEALGPRGWVQFELGGGDVPLDVDRLEIDARALTSSWASEEWTCAVMGSEDGHAWTELGRTTGKDRLFSSFLPGGVTSVFRPSVTLKAPSRSRHYRVLLEAPNVARWRIGEVLFFHGDKRLEIGGPYDFTSAWKSAGRGEEWVSVDLGTTCSFDRLAFHWIHRAAEGAVQASDDAESWRTLQTFKAAKGLTDELKLAQPAHGRHVRVLMTRPASEEGYVLSEMEVYGRGGPLPCSRPAEEAGPDGRTPLAGGAWRVRRDSLVTSDGARLSQPGFRDEDWLPATVPGTVLSSYWNAGALPDPNFGGNQLMISDSFFYADFWYRKEFVTPRAEPGRRIWLSFDGINWKALVFLNGQELGRIEGGFMRGRFDVTSHIRFGAPNALAVLVKKNATPGSVKEKTSESPGWNGGALGADNPTYHASVGWDWIPTIRGRNCGIWGDVYLTTSGPVTIEAPFVSTALPLPRIDRADVTVEVTLRNNDQRAVTGTLRGRFGEAMFERPWTVDGDSSVTVKIDSSEAPELRLVNPKLWWPNGYGEPHLYDVELSFRTADGAISDKKAFRAGVRQFAYDDEDGALKIWINGRRFIGRGGNWGFPESMLRYR